MVMMILQKVLLINNMPLVELKYFNALIDNKPFFDKPVKTKQESCEKLLKCQEIMIIQQEIYRLFVSSKLL